MSIHSDLQPVWKVEVVDVGFGEFTRISCEEFRAVEYLGEVKQRPCSTDLGLRSRLIRPRLDDVR